MLASAFTFESILMFMFPFATDTWTSICASASINTHVHSHVHMCIFVEYLHVCMHACIILYICLCVVVSACFALHLGSCFQFYADLQVYFMFAPVSYSTRHSYLRVYKNNIHADAASRPHETWSNLLIYSLVALLIRILYYPY